MAISPRASEVAAVAEAIEDQDSLEAVAKMALKASYAALQSRPAPGEKLEKGLWVVVIEGPLLYGPFGTYNEAAKAVQNGKIPNYERTAERLREEGLVPTAEAMILPMKGPLAMAEKAISFDREARIFSNHLCSTCEHRLVKHGVNSNTGACSIAGCDCKRAKPITL